MGVWSDDLSVSLCELTIFSFIFNKLTFFIIPFSVLGCPRGLPSISSRVLINIPVPGSKPLARESFSGPNYLVYDDHGEAPPGLASKGGKKGAGYLVDKWREVKKVKLGVTLFTDKF